MNGTNDLKVLIRACPVKSLSNKVYSLIFILILLFSILIPYLISALLGPWMLFIYWSLLALIAIMISYLYIRSEVE